jgi:hypothetical protein
MSWKVMTVFRKEAYQIIHVVDTWLRRPDLVSFQREWPVAHDKLELDKRIERMVVEVLCRSRDWLLLVVVDTGNRIWVGTKLMVVVDV